MSNEVIKQLEEEKEYAYADFEEYAEEHNLDSFYRGMERAIAVIKAAENKKRVIRKVGVMTDKQQEKELIYELKNSDLPVDTQEILIKLVKKAAVEQKNK